VWVSFTLEDSTACRLRDKQPLAAAVQELVTQHASLDAVLVNCCAPAAVTAAMPVLKSCVAPGVLAQ
jgi:homocysteine S-methyltransferase